MQNFTGVSKIKVIEINNEKGVNISDKIYIEKVKKMQDLVTSVDKMEINFIKNLKNPDTKIKQTMFVLLHLFTDVELDLSPKSDKNGNIDMS